MSTYTLPPLPYDYDALEPFVSAKLMELHHDRHHAAYVKGANLALEALADQNARKGPARTSQLTRTLAFNVAGHINHTVFWQNLSPSGGGMPTGELANVIARDYGSFETFKDRFTAVAASVQGSGWAMLAYEPCAQHTMIMQLHDHQSGLAAGSIPLLMLDVWEHAYYHDYQNDRENYLRGFWDFVNWDNVSTRLEAARNA